MEMPAVSENSVDVRFYPNLKLFTIKIRMPDHLEHKYMEHLNSIIDGTELHFISRRFTSCGVEIHYLLKAEKQEEFHIDNEKIINLTMQFQRSFLELGFLCHSSEATDDSFVVEIK